MLMVLALSKLRKAYELNEYNRDDILFKLVNLGYSPLRAQHIERAMYKCYKLLEKHNGLAILAFIDKCKGKIPLPLYISITCSRFIGPVATLRKLGVITERKMTPEEKDLVRIISRQIRKPNNTFKIDDITVTTYISVSEFPLAALLTIYLLATPRTVYEISSMLGYSQKYIYEILYVLKKYKLVKYSLKIRRWILLSSEIFIQVYNELLKRKAKLEHLIISKAIILDCYERGELNKLLDYLIVNHTLTYENVKKVYIKYARFKNIPLYDSDIGELARYTYEFVEKHRARTGEKINLRIYSGISQRKLYEIVEKGYTKLITGG